MNDELAILGADVAFPEPIPVGQLYFPSWQRYQASMEGIFERRYYTNQGPLTREFEAKLESYLGVKHVICVTNATIGLMMAAEALELTGRVILPSFTFIASAQSLSWCGLEPVFCDVDPHTHQIDINQLDKLFDESVSAIMGVNLWGGACSPETLEEYVKKKGIQVYFDSAHAFGCEVNGKRVGGFGSLEVFSFHATKILSACEGGCISTNDDIIASKLRNIRSSYGAGHPVSVVKTSNGRMSEAQAAIGLLSLEDLGANQANNRAIFETYKELLATVDGIKLVNPSGVTVSNYQYVVVEIDELDFGLSRDQLILVLEADNILARRYFYPGLHRTAEFSGGVCGEELPETDALSHRCLQLPVGAAVDIDTVHKICKIISLAASNAKSIEACCIGDEL